MIITFSAPNLNATRAESRAVFPPPITVIVLPIFTGVSYSGNLYAFIKLVLVRNSFAVRTPFKFNPGILFIMGKPAPTPIKNALKPISFKSLIVKVFPIIILYSIFTPNIFKVSISFSTISLGSRNSGIP